MGILVGGGPAPGINSVIGAATIRACLSGQSVVGIHDGFKWLMQGNLSRTTRLTIEDTSRIHFRGGSHIGISRNGPASDPVMLDAILKSLWRLDIDKLIVIGGDGTGSAAHAIERRAGGALAVVHVPKTIDNDLDLPHDAVSFGFQTARHVGVGLVHNLMVDARTTARWFFAVTMGRKAGHLALAIGKSAGATLTLIPEEFGGRRVTSELLVDILAGAIIKRQAWGRPDGIAVLAEGLVTLLDPDELATLGPVTRDALGRLHIGDIPYGEILKQRVVARLRPLGITTPVVAKSLGYELRCADPIPLDMEYTRDLGYGAAKYLVEGGSGAMITLQNGRLIPIPFERLVDPLTGDHRVRLVDTESDRYKIARTYMIRLKREDFDDAADLARIAAAVSLSPEDFREQFGHVVESESSLSLAPPAIRARE